MEIDITELIVAIVTIIIGLLANRLIPYLNEKYTAEQLDNIRKWTKIAVEAAEMIYASSGMGATKKQYVLDFLHKKGFTVDTETLDNFIESAVQELNIEKAKTK